MPNKVVLAICITASAMMFAGRLVTIEAGDVWMGDS